MKAVAAAALAAEVYAALEGTGHTAAAAQMATRTLVRDGADENAPFCDRSNDTTAVKGRDKLRPAAPRLRRPRRLGVAVRVPVRPGARCRGRPRPALSGLRDLPLTAVGLVEYITKGGRFL